MKWEFGADRSSEARSRRRRQGATPRAGYSSEFPNDQCGNEISDETLRDRILCVNTARTNSSQQLSIPVTNLEN